MGGFRRGNNHAVLPVEIREPGLPETVCQDGFSWFFLLVVFLHFQGQEKVSFGKPVLFHMFSVSFSVNFRLLFENDHLALFERPVSD